MCILEKFKWLSCNLQALTGLPIVPNLPATNRYSRCAPRSSRSSPAHRTGKRDRVALLYHRVRSGKPSIEPVPRRRKTSRLLGQRDAPAFQLPKDLAKRPTALLECLCANVDAVSSSKASNAVKDAGVSFESFLLPDGAASAALQTKARPRS